MRNKEFLAKNNAVQNTFGSGLFSHLRPM